MEYIVKRVRVEELREYSLRLDDALIRDINKDWAEVYIDSKPMPVITADMLRDWIKDEFSLEEEETVYDIKSFWGSGNRQMYLSEWCSDWIDEYMDEVDYEVAWDEYIDSEWDIQ